MKWTYDWLKDYLNTDADAQTVSDTLTRIGLEVEDMQSPISPIAAKIVECKPHENSDHLHVLQVDDGTSTLRQVVCGAPNARVGLISALAIPGCVIGGHEIQSGKLRGVLSDCMMCSGKELGINDDHSGIIELPEDTVIGSPVIESRQFLMQVLHQTDRIIYLFVVLHVIYQQQAWVHISPHLINRLKTYLAIARLY